MYDNLDNIVNQPSNYELEIGILITIGIILILAIVVLTIIKKFKDK